MGEKVSCPDHMLCLHGLGMRLVEKHLPATVLGCKKNGLGQHLVDHFPPHSLRPCGISSFGYEGSFSMSWCSLTDYLRLVNQWVWLEL